MNPDHVPDLVCPDCRTEGIRIERANSVDGRIESAGLSCRGCGSDFELNDGIARMLPRKLRESDAPTETMKRDEMRARDDQAERYDAMKMLRAFGKAELPLTVRYLEPRASDRLIEVGCGTGRLTTEIAPRVGSTVGVDFSLRSLERCRRKLDDAGLRHVTLVQADACALPIRSGAFSKVLSCQVLEHLPSAESRSEMVRELGRVAQPASNIVVSAYKNSAAAKLLLKKEGRHGGEIYFYRFDWPELESLLGTALRVERKTGALVYHYLTRCTPATN